MKSDNRCFRQGLISLPSLEGPFEMGVVMVRWPYRGSPNGIRVAIAVFLCALLSTSMFPFSAFADDSLGAAAVADDSLSSGNPSFVGEPNSDDAGEDGITWGTVPMEHGVSDSIEVMGASSAGYTWPLRSAGSISQGYTWNGSKGHGGVDIAIPAGSDVIASMSGTVKYIHRYNARTSLNDTSMNSYGNLVILFHPNGTTTYYAHMQDIAVSVGQQVSQGQVVGHVGLTGATTGYHLHFELRTGASASQSLSGQGTRQNPLNYVGPGNLYEGASAGRNPVGYLDAATGGDGTVTVRGWAYDPDNPSASIEVHVYVDGTASNGEGHGGIKANLPRPDVNRVYGISGNHGFEATFTTGKRGSPKVYAYGINIGGGGNAQLNEVKTAKVAGIPSSSTVSVPTGIYSIRTKVNAARVFDILGASKADRADLVLSTWNGGGNQKFNITLAGGSAHYIVATHSNKAVEVYGASTASNANVSQFTQNKENCQKWFIDANSDGTYCLRNKGSDLNMDVPDANPKVGASIWQYVRNNTNAQKFYLVPVDASRWNISVPAQAYTGSSVKPAPVVTAGGVRLQQGKDYTVSYGNNVDVGTGTLTITAKNGYSGKKSAAFRINVNNKAPMYRLYNPYSGEHFYTGNASEKNNLVKLGWRYEGIGWNAPKSGKDVYRLYNPYTGDHHFTPNASEKNACVAAGWRYEGVGWKSNGSVKVYREYNPYAKAFYHNYTRDAKEHAYLCSIGWRSEGTGWNGV